MSGQHRGWTLKVRREATPSILVGLCGPSRPHPFLHESIRPSVPAWGSWLVILCPIPSLGRVALIGFLGQVSALVQPALASP